MHRVTPSPASTPSRSAALLLVSSAHRGREARTGSHVLLFSWLQQQQPQAGGIKRRLVTAAAGGGGCLHGNGQHKDIYTHACSRGPHTLLQAVLMCSCDSVISMDQPLHKPTHCMRCSSGLRRHRGTGKPPAHSAHVVVVLVVVVVGTRATVDNSGTGRTAHHRAGQNQPGHPRLHPT